MPDHYGPGWELQHAPSVEAAGDIAYQLFQMLKPVAATRNTLLPVGGDYSPPNNWVTELHRGWNDALRVAEVRLRDHEALPRPGPRRAWPSRAARRRRRRRDMNPIYTGKDVSYIDTKQAQRAAEIAAIDAEKLTTFAALLGRGPVPRGRAGQGVAAARVRRAPRRDHRVRGRPGLHRPAHGLARGVRPRVGGARGRRVGDRRAHRHARRRCGRSSSLNTLAFDALRPGASAGRHVARRSAARRPRRRGPGRRGGAGRRPVRRSGRPLDGMAHLPRPRRWTRGGVDRRRGRRGSGDRRERRIPGHRRPGARRDAHLDRRPAAGPGAAHRPGQRAAGVRGVCGAPAVQRGPVAPVAQRSLRARGGRRGASRVAGECDRASAGRARRGRRDRLRAGHDARRRPGPGRPHDPVPRPRGVGPAGPGAASPSTSRAGCR